MILLRRLFLVVGVGLPALLLGMYLSASVAANGGPFISNVQTNAAEIERYEKFEITFEITGTTATTPDLPYDPAPPPGVTPGTGITVEALFSNDNWQTTLIQPAFLYQDYVRSQRSNLDHIYPVGQPVWTVRFAAPETGVWRYRLQATDAGGSVIYPANGDLTVTVVQSERPGFLHVSQTDPRYFEFDSGLPFIGIGHNESFESIEGGLALSTYVADEKLARFQETAANFFRVWLSASSVAGSGWAPWTSHIRDYYGNVPYITLSAEETFAADGLTMRLSPYDACVFQGFQGGPVPVLPARTYQVSVRVKTVDVDAPATPGYPYGFTVKTGTWLGRTDDPDNPLLCDDPDQGTSLIPHLSGDSGWQVVTGTFATESDQYFLPNFYLVLDNALVTNNPDTEGKAYIDYVWVQEVLPGGDLGPNVIKKPGMSMHAYFDQAPAWQWDYILDQAAAAGVYLKLVALEKDDLLYSSIGPDGVFDRNQANDTNSYAQPGTRVRWLHAAWWRYLVARWGYSPAVHSWELFNEGNPYDEAHYAHAQAMADYVYQQDPNRHMVTTSFWSSYPVPEFWANPAYSAIDYANVHAYVSTGEGVYAFWGDGFEPPLAIETNPAHTIGGRGWSIRIPGSQPFAYINQRLINIRGQGEWALRYQMKAQNFSGSCSGGYPDSLAGPRLTWELKQNETVINGNQVPPSADGLADVCAAPAGTYDWTPFNSRQTAGGALAPVSARIILSNDNWYSFTIDFYNNDAGGGGWAWVDNIQLIAPDGQEVTLNGHFDLTPMNFDAALYTASRSMRDSATGPLGAGKPLVRGEAGLDYANRQEEHADLADDTSGVWFHNFVWGQINAGGMYDLYWWTNNIWGNDLHYHIKPYQDFMTGIPLNNGRYVDAKAIASEPGLRVLGQKGGVQAHLWIQNKTHTWRNVVDGLTIQPLTGTVTISDMPPGPYEVQWWDSYGGGVVYSETILAMPTLTLTLPYPLSDDIAVKVSRPWDLSGSTKSVDPLFAEPGQVLTYTITLRNAGSQLLSNGYLIDSAPTQTTFLSNSVQIASGAATMTADLLEWRGSVGPTTPVTISFRAIITPNLGGLPVTLINRALISDGETLIERQASTIISDPVHTPTATPTPTLPPSSGLQHSKAVTPSTADAGAIVTYLLTTIPHSLPVTTTTWITDQLPSLFTLISDSVSSNVNPVAAEDGYILWSGTFSNTGQLTLTYQMIISTALPMVVTNVATFYNPELDMAPQIRSAGVLVNPFEMYLPLVLKLK